jgi:hypothetical protein
VPGYNFSAHEKTMQPPDSGDLCHIGGCSLEAASSHDGHFPSPNRSLSLPTEPSDLVDATCSLQHCLALLATKDGPVASRDRFTAAAMTVNPALPPVVSVF